MGQPEGIECNGKEGWDTAQSDTSDLRADLRVGERYFESKPPHHVWIVSKIYTPPASTLPHVLLDRCGRFPASKLLSVEVLQDTNFFRKDRRNPFAEVSQSNKRRRVTDPFK